MKSQLYLVKIIVCTLLLLPFYLKSYSQTPENACFSLCTIDLNKDVVFYSEVKKLEFQTVVVPSLFAINLEHYRAYLNYKIPFDTLSKALGLNLIFGKLVPTCCDCNGNTGCASDVSFHKLSSTCASFSWDSKSNKIISKDVVIGNYKFHISFPGKFSGIAKVSPNYLHIEFQQDNIEFSVTDISIVGNPKVLIKYSIKGAESTAWKGILYPSCSNRPFKLPIMPIYLQPK